MTATSQKIYFLNPTSVDVCARLFCMRPTKSLQPAHCIVLSARFVEPDLGNLSADIISCREKGRVDNGSLYKFRADSIKFRSKTPQRWCFKVRVALVALTQESGPSNLELMAPLSVSFLWNLLTLIFAHRVRECKHINIKLWSVGRYTRGLVTVWRTVYNYEHVHPTPLFAVR